MKANPLPPIEVLRERYRYDADTGKLYSRTTTYNKRLRRSVLCNGWREVTASNKHGYIVTGFKGTQIKAHRLCWALHYNEDPYPFTIDHINRNKQDNTIRNLRKVTQSENCKNRDDPNKHKHRPVKITYPDGRGVIVTDSIKTAATILNRTYGCIQQHLRRGNTNPLRWGHGGRDNYSGIHVEYA